MKDREINENESSEFDQDGSGLFWTSYEEFYERELQQWESGFMCTSPQAVEALRSVKIDCVLSGGSRPALEMVAESQSMLSFLDWLIEHDDDSSESEADFIELAIALKRNIHALQLDLRLMAHMKTEFFVFLNEWSRYLDFLVHARIGMI